MMSPTSVKTNRRGVTLIEMLVVIGILALLAGILLPAVMRVMRSAERTKTAGLLQTISVGLEAYFNDHQQYPPIPANATGPAVLGRALLAPGPAVLALPAPGPANPPEYAATTLYNYGDVVQDGGIEYVCISATSISAIATSVTTSWLPFGYHDGADGFGFRTRSLQGKTYAYLQPDRMKIRGVSILDAGESPILYYVARPGKPNITTGQGYVSAGGASLYDSNHSVNHLNPQAMRYLLGDTNTTDGNITGAETAAHTGPYILWAAGPDGIYGITTPLSASSSYEASKCDDVTNFK